MKKIYFICLISLFSFPNFAQDISTIRSQPLGSTVTVSGIATNGDELGVIRYLEDGTAGIALYDQTTNNYLSNILRGDSITITGELADYNGLLEVYVTGLPVIHSNNNILPIPQLVTPNQIGETTESELIEIHNAVFNSGGGIFSVGTYDFTSNGQQGKIYLKTNHPLLGDLIPTSPVTLIGISSQYTFNIPANDGYQILPRDSADIILPAGLIITSAIIQSNITNSGFDLSWSTSDSSTTEVFYGTTPNIPLHAANSSNTMLHNFSFNNMLLAGTIYYVQCFSVKGTDTAFSNIKVYATKSNSSGIIRPYFNHSVDVSFSSGVDAQNIGTYFNDTIKAYMDLAQSTLDICVYNASDATIANAINDAYDRGVNVRYIADDDVANTMLSSLNTNIPIVYRDNSVAGIMHNKFIIIDAYSTDNSWIMTGSCNWTNPSNLFNDYNNLIFIQDESLAKAYTLEFEEMWNGNFGSNKIDNTPHKFNIAGTEVESYFSPSDQTTTKILEFISNVDYSLEFGLLSFTRDDIGSSVIDKDNEFGVVVRGIIEQANVTGSEFSNLTAAGVNVQSHTGIPKSLHHKYAISDALIPASDPSILTGSHNWSSNAENNSDENTLIIHNETIANIYLQEFEARWKELSTSSINNIEDHNIILYPVPSKGIIEIMSKNPIQKIEIYNLEGKLLFSKNKNRIFIEEPGFYISKIIDSNGNTVIREIIIE